MNANKCAQILEHQLGEMTDGYLLIAFSQNGEPITRSDCRDAKTALAINNILTQIVATGGIGVTEPHGA